MKQNIANLRPELPEYLSVKKFKKKKKINKSEKSINPTIKMVGDSDVFSKLFYALTRWLWLLFSLLILQESQNISEEEIQNNYHQKSPKIDCTNLVQYLQQQRTRIPLLDLITELHNNKKNQNQNQKKQNPRKSSVANRFQSRQECIRQTIRASQQCHTLRTPHNHLTR